MVQPGGPTIHFGRCSGLVCTSNTRSLGAATTRVIRPSSSLGSSIVVTPSSPVIVIVGLLLRFGCACCSVLDHLQVGVQACVALVPEAPVVVGELGHLLQRPGLQPA